MTTLRVPDVLAQGRWWSGDALDAMARAWRAAVLDRCGDGDRPIAAALPTSPEAVALFAALTSLPSPIILLSPDVHRLSGAPVLPLLARLEGHRHVVTVHPPLPTDEPDPGRRLDAWQAIVTSLVVDYVRRFPEQCPVLVHGLRPEGAASSREAAARPVSAGGAPERH